MSAAKKQEWMIILPDQADALERRLQVRPDHFKGVKPGVDAGMWKFGGAFFESAPVEGQTPPFKGSIMLAEAATKEEVIEVLKKDIYTQKNVWDWDKVQVFPFKSAFRVGVDLPTSV